MKRYWYEDTYDVLWVVFCVGLIHRNPLAFIPVHWSVKHPPQRIYYGHVQINSC